MRGVLDQISDESAASSWCNTIGYPNELQIDETSLRKPLFVRKMGFFGRARSCTILT
jgi:hypothetical protein